MIIIVELCLETSKPCLPQYIIINNTGIMLDGREQVLSPGSLSPNNWLLLPGENINIWIEHKTFLVQDWQSLTLPTSQCLENLFIKEGLY